MPRRGMISKRRLRKSGPMSLHLDRVGIHDNFFSIGGDSIRSLQVVARAHKSGIKLTPKHLFEHPTVAEVAAVAATVAC